MLLDAVGRDDEERSGVTGFDDRLGSEAFDCTTTDDALDFTGVAVPLSFDDLAREEDAFEVEDRKVVIFEFFRCVNGYDVVQRPNQVANPSYGQLRHIGSLPNSRRSAQLPSPGPARVLTPDAGQPIPKGFGDRSALGLSHRLGQGLGQSFGFRVSHVTHHFRCTHTRGYTSSRCRQPAASPCPERAAGGTYRRPGNVRRDHHGRLAASTLTECPVSETFRWRTRLEKMLDEDR